MADSVFQELLWIKIMECFGNMMQNIKSSYFFLERAPKCVILYQNNVSRWRWTYNPKGKTRKIRALRNWKAGNKNIWSSIAYKTYGVDRLWQMKLYLQSTYGRVYLALMQEKEARAHREPCHVVVEVGDGTPNLELNDNT
jgi:hypothetical protein